MVNEVSIAATIIMITAISPGTIMLREVSSSLYQTRLSAVARSQLLATQMAMILTFLPAFLLSGFMYAIDVMPKALQLLTYLVPARYFLVVTRGIFLKGVGADVLRVQGLLMIGFAVIGLALAIFVFRKEIR